MQGVSVFYYSPHVVASLGPSVQTHVFQSHNVKSDLKIALFFLQCLTVLTSFLRSFHKFLLT